MSAENLAALKAANPCPDWCEYQDHERDAENHPDDGLQHIAYVSRFHIKKTTAVGFKDEWGALSWRPEGDVEVCQDDGREALAERLREISTDARTAAEWIEAHA